MPYSITFSKTIQAQDTDLYINECCFGGDVISEQLLPTIREHYADMQANQEDWGWFIWFRDGAVSLAVDIFCEDSATGKFRIHISSRKKRWLFSSVIIDTPELEKLKQQVTAKLNEWAGSPAVVELLNARFM